MYIPMKIKNSSPENELMARNILFGRYTTRNNKPVTAHALYNPESSSLEIEDKVVCVSMNYYNELDKRAKIVLKCFLSSDGTKKYEATKYFENKKIGIAKGGDDWNRFFTQVSFLNFVEGEKVRFKEI
ncbi:MAG: hypothetical protein U9N04_00215, partial [Patescibacteria group bacterium]|nr:hypothetical protein [Patescibacteria group bacterium]